MSINETNIGAGEFAKNAYSVYGKYTIENRAVPDFRDGCKPVQRRIMYAMFANKIYPNAHHSKSARVVGEVIGKYHPHGDSSVYQALVGLVNDRYPLIHGEGNFGSYDDPAAAQRYTECRMSDLAMRLFDCIDIADWVENYDSTLQEPVVLPSRLPLALMNGAEGIAVGLSSNIPSHNLGELIEAIKIVLKKGDKATVDDILKHIQGPDYFGGVITSTEDEIRELYTQGWGSIRYKCRYHLEDIDGSPAIVIDSFPPHFQPASFMVACSQLADQGLIDSVTDETDINGIRIVVQCSSISVIQSRIVPLMSSSISYQLYVTERLPNGDIKVKFVTFIQMIQEWLNFRRDNEEKLLNLELEKQNIKLEREEARLWVMQDVDKVVDLIKNAKSNEDMISKLVKYLQCSEQAAEYISNLPLRSLMKIDIPEQKAKISDIKAYIKDIKTDLDHIDDVILRNLIDLAKYADDRRTITLSEFREPNFSNVDGGTFFVTASKEGVIAKNNSLSLKGKGWSWEYLAEVKQGVTTVTDTGLAGQWNIGFMKDGKSGYPSIVGLVPFEKEILVVLDDQGCILAIDHTQNVDEYQTIKTEGKVVKAVGLSKGDSLFCWDSRCDTVIVYKAEDLPLKRRNSYGWYPVPRRTKGVDIAVIPKGCSMISTKDGSILSYDEALQQDFIVAGDKNFIIDDKGLKGIMTLNDVIENISYIWQCYPVKDIEI